MRWPAEQKVPRMKEHSLNSAWKGRKPGRGAKEGEARPGAGRSVQSEQLERKLETQHKGIECQGESGFIPLGTPAGQPSSQECDLKRQTALAPTPGSADSIICVSYSSPPSSIPSPIRWKHSKYLLVGTWD